MHITHNCVSTPLERLLNEILIAIINTALIRIGLCEECDMRCAIYPGYRLPYHATSTMNINMNEWRDKRAIINLLLTTTKNDDRTSCESRWQLFKMIVIQAQAQLNLHKNIPTNTIRMTHEKMKHPRSML